MANRKKLPHWLSKRENDGFIRIPYSMMGSPAWRSLAGSPKDLYFYCQRWQYQAGARTQQDPQKYPRDRWTEGGDIRPTDFYINPTKAVAYGLIDSTKNRNTIYRDIDALVNHGFIDRVFPGKGKDKSVFRMSDRWTDYTPDK